MEFGKTDRQRSENKTGRTRILINKYNLNKLKLLLFFYLICPLRLLLI